MSPGFTLNEIKVTSASFPIDKANEENYRATIDEALPDVSGEIAIDHLEANYATTTAFDKAMAVPVKNDPPQIIFATTPTLLIMIDGAPQVRPVQGYDKVQRVLNSRALILLDQASNTFWLTATGRWYKAPELPTMDEAGAAGLVLSFWHGLWVPKGTPSDVLGRLQAAVVASLAEPAVHARFTDLGLTMATQAQATPAALAAYHKAETEKWWPIIKAAGIKPE